MKKLLTIICLAFLPALAFAHGGGLDQNGGHYDHQRGGYHCHRC